MPSQCFHKPLPPQSVTRPVPITDEALLLLSPCCPISAPPPAAESPGTYAPSNHRWLSSGRSRPFPSPRASTRLGGWRPWSWLLFGRRCAETSSGYPTRTHSPSPRPRQSSTCASSACQTGTKRTAMSTWQRSRGTSTCGKMERILRA